MERFEQNNVYGHFYSNSSLEKLAYLLRWRLGYSEDEVWVKKSQYDGIQKIRIDRKNVDFESTKIDKKGKYLFNGTITGTEDEICQYLENLQNIMNHADYQSEFEVYDEKYKCIKVFSAS